MLRKRTSFKPNLKQVAPTPTPQQQQTTPNNAPQNAAGAGQQTLTDGPPLSGEPSEVAVNTNRQQNELVINDAQQSNPSTLSGSNNNNHQSVCHNIELQQAQPTTVSTQQTNPPPPPNDPNGESCNTTSKDAAGSKQIQDNDIPEMSNQRVQEAITQLTGQKFEPIKSLSLRSSANKNVKLKDLLFFNPPMTKDQKRHKKSVCLAKKTANEQQQQKKSPTSEIEPQQDPPVVIDTTSNDTNNNNNNNVEDMDTQDTTSTANEEHSLVPKVKMGPEGKLILDESSTIINRKNLIKEQEAIVEDNEDIISRTNYDSFRRRPTNTSQTKWSMEDTKKFYHALTILGTDFSMMESLLFSGLRSRTELHKKFKREERVNKLKIDIALSNRISLNSEELEDLREIFYKQ